MIDLTSSPQWYQPSHLIIERNSGLGDLYLGDINAALDLQWLEKNNILTVISAADGMKQVQYGKNIKHIKYPLQDTKTQNISKYFDQVFQVIQDARAKGNILIHCAAGVSRSATLVIAYLIKKNRWTFKQSIAFVRQKRRTVCPNLGFQMQLKQYQKVILQGNGRTKSAIMRIYDSVKNQNINSIDRDEPNQKTKNKSSMMKRRRMSYLHRKPQKNQKNLVLERKLDLQKNLIIKSYKDNEQPKFPERAIKPKTSNYPVRNIFTSS